MRTWVKILIGGVAALAALVFIALGAVRLSLDPAAYRARIQAAVSHALGRSVTINGPIGMSAFSMLEIRFEDVRVVNPRGFGNRLLAHIDNAYVSLRVLPLILGEIRIGRLTLDGLDLRLVRRADGHRNWRGLAHRLTVAGPIDPSANAAVGQYPPPGGLPIASLRIGALAVHNARIDYDDAAAGRHYRLSNADLETGRISSARPFRLETDSDFSQQGADFTAAVYLTALAEPDLSHHFYRFSGLSMNVLASGPAVPGGRQEANLGASGDIDLEAGRFALDDFTLQSAGVKLTGKVDGTGLNDDLRYHGRITIDEFSPRSALRQFALDPPETQASSNLTDASFDAQFTGGIDSIDLKQIAARLDQSTLTGTVNMRDFAKPRYNVDLALDTLNIDDYLPPASAAQAKTSQPAETDGGASEKAAAFDLAPLHHLRLKGRLAVGSLTAAGLDLTGARIRMSAADDRLRISPLTADLYGGSIYLDGAVNAGAACPRYRMQGRARRIAIKPLWADVADNERLQGRGSIRVDLRACGRQVAQLKRSLSGHVAFELSNGRINNVDLKGLLLAAEPRRNGQDPGAARDDDSATVFKRLGGHFKFVDGMATGHDLKLVMPEMIGHGRGRYSLANNQLDYTLTVDVADHAGSALAPLAGRRIPLRLRGAVLSPDYAVEMRSATRRQAPRPGSPKAGDVSSSSQDGG